MANEPISALTQTTTASATDCVPIVSPGLTQKVALNTLVQNSGIPVYAEPYFYQSGSWLCPPGATTLGTMPFNVLTVSPLILSVTTSFQGAAVYPTSATSTLVPIVLYNSNAFNMPNTLIANLGTVSLSAANVARATTFSPLTLQAGVYWVGTVSQSVSGGVQVCYYSDAVHALPTPSLMQSIVVGYGMNGVSGTIPSTYVINSALSVNVPRVWLQYV
jgi:hypothetical protein